VKKTFLVFFVFFMTIAGICQVSAPRHESWVHHVFAKHRDADNLASRVDDLKCAMVLIKSGNSLGTGFFVSADGDIATASHVVGDRNFLVAQDSSVSIQLTGPDPFLITLVNGTTREVRRSSIEVDGNAWSADLALIHSKIDTSCWLDSVDDRKVRPGDHLITLGFPGLSFQALTVYTGIRSARMTHNLPVVILPNGLAVNSPVDEFVRVQMPVSPGLSGAPVIDDENRVLAVLTQAGGWTQDLQNLTTLLHIGALQLPAPPNQANSPTININVPAVLGQLANLFHDYASPGYGDAVPLRYLKQQPQQTQTPSSHDHQ
jgi:S1-C subfamily serine protease